MADIQKLPKWAQTEIERLRAVNNQLEKSLRDAIGTAENVSHRTPIGVGGHEKPNVPLPFNRIDFPAFGIEVHVGQYHRLYITSRSGTLRVEPQASNVICVMGHQHDHESMAPEACAT